MGDCGGCRWGHCTGGERVTAPGKTLLRGRGPWHWGAYGGPGTPPSPSFVGGGQQHCLGRWSGLAPGPCPARPGGGGHPPGTMQWFVWARGAPLFGLGKKGERSPQMPAALAHPGPARNRNNAASRRQVAALRRCSRASPPPPPGGSTEHSAPAQVDRPPRTGTRTHGTRWERVTFPSKGHLYPWGQPRPSLILVPGENSFLPEECRGDGGEWASLPLPLCQVGSWEE